MTDFGASSNSSESEIFFRMTDRLQMESCAMAMVKDGKSVVISSKTTELIDHFGAAFIRRLKRALPDTPIEVFMPPDTEAMLDRFNKLLTTLKLDEATKPRGGQLPEKIWVVHDANALATHELDLLTRLILQFPGAGIGAVLMFASESAQADKLATQNKQFVSWALELPTAEQKLSAIQQARKNGNEDAAVKFFNRLSRDAATQVGKASKEKSETKDPKTTEKKSAETAKSAIKKPTNNRKLWPWALVVSGMLAISVGVAAMLHPELTNQFAADLNKMFDSKTYEPKVKPKAKIELPAEKPAEATGGPTIVQGEVPTPVSGAPTPTPAVLEPVPTPAPPAPQVVSVEPPAPAKPEKVITELPEGAVQGRLWLKGLPDDSYVLQHGTFASLKQARAAMKDKEWLANARVVPVFTEGKDEAEFALVTGPFRTKDRAQNTVTRLKLSGSVSVQPSASLYKQALQPKAKP